MADVYEQNLPNKANLTTNDYIRVVGSDNNSYKQLVNDVAKKIIENYTGSSLAGSSQSVKSALDTLNSKTTGTVRGVSGSNPNLIVRQYGKVVVINGYVNNASLTANTAVHIVTISGVSLPTEAVRTLCGVATAAYEHPTDVAYLYIGTDGEVTVTSTINGSRSIYFTASYII